jgi:hypothetical protein
MKKVPVKKATLLARVNRKLKKDGQRLYAARSEAARAALGDWYILDRATRRPVKTKVDLEEIARVSETIAPYEKIEED